MKIILKRVIRGFKKSFGTETLRRTKIFTYEDPGLLYVPRVGEYIEGGPLKGIIDNQGKVISVFHNLNTNKVEIYLSQVTRFMDKTTQYFPCDTGEEYDEKTCEGFDAEIKRYEAIGWKIDSF